MSAGGQIRVIRLEAQNVKRIRAVDITPDGALVAITGRNEQGKSTVLDCLWWALAGAKNIQSVPIRTGESTAAIRLTLGTPPDRVELVVERRFTAKSSYLHVENADGSPFASPQMLLDRLLGALTFDPLAFTRMKPVEQFDQLRRAVKIDLDFDALDRATQAEYARRTELQRQARDRAAQARGIPLPDDLPEQPIDTEALLDVIARGDTDNAAIETERAARAGRERDRAFAVTSADHTAAEVRAAQAKIAELEATIAALRQQIVADQETESRQRLHAQAIGAELAALPPLPAPVDTTATRAALRQAQTTNEWIAQRARSRAMAEEAEALQAQADQLTASMEARAQQRADAIAAARMPVEGLSLGDKCVIYQGLPFDQASLAVRIRVSLAIAMATGSELRVVRIVEGSALDSASMALVREMAEQHDFQVWVEAMREDGKTGIVIEDGEVASTPASREAAAREAAP